MTTDMNTINHAFNSARAAAIEYANQTIALQEEMHPDDVMYLRKRVPHINQQWQSLVDEWIERNFFDD